MRRASLGLVVGALAAIATLALDQRRLALLTPLVALLAGLLIGALVGWRLPRPGGAALLGGLAGLLAGALLLLGARFGGALQTRLLAGVALAAALLSVALGAACAGLASGWTGYGQHPQGVGQGLGDLDDLDEQSARGATSGPLGPAPRVE